VIGYISVQLFNLNKKKVMENKFRTIRISHEEIEIIKTSLQYVYDKKLDLIGNNRKVLNPEAIKSILNSANAYFDVQDIFNGDRDV
jgi:hypothetical protein